MPVANPAASPLSSETTVGSYRVHRTIAEGDVATVREAAHLVLPRRAAIKLLRPEVVGSPQAAQRVLREACVLEAFTHPGIVRVFDTGLLEDGRPWFAMELVGGEPLSAVLARVGPLPVEEVLELTTGVVDVLAAAHRSGIVHRDLGAGHVLVGGGGWHGVRVVGWGLARQPGGGHDLTADRRADVYAAGAMAYQAATGQPPFVSVPPLARVTSQFHATPMPVRNLRPDISPELATLIDSMLAADPAARPTASEVSARLARMEVPYDDFQMLAEGTRGGHDVAEAANDDSEPAHDDGERAPAAEPASPGAASAKSQADRDWEALMALGAVRRPSSRRAPRLAACRDDQPRAARASK